MTLIKHILKQPTYLFFNIRSYSVCNTLTKSSLVKEENNESSLKSDVFNSHYYFEDGLRKVYPYYYHHSSFCKERWLNKKIIDAYSDEFALYTREECEQRITKGIVKINRRKVDLDYVLKNADLMTADVHKHELPVLACPIEILFEDGDFLVVDKPPSIPVHACGLYLKNSMLSILEKEYNKHNLYVIYRLDRLTSGVLVFAKSSKMSIQIHEEMHLRNISKEYVCRVEGNFPEGTVICNKSLKHYYHKIGVCLVDPAGKESLTEFKKLSYNGKSSVVLCKPHTGRTHQIRVHLQCLGHPIINDPLYNSFVFGELKAKNGLIEKSISKLLDDMLEEHSSQWGFDNPPIKINNLDKRKYLNFSIFKEHFNINKELPSFKKDCSRFTYDEDCYFCKTVNHDPQQHTLGLFLHACKYEGKNWSFKSEMPFWASEDWNIA